MTSTIDQLTEIPELARLVLESADAPHREQSGKRSKVIGSPMPTRVACHAMLHDLQRKLADAVRVAVEEMRSHDVWDPEPSDPFTWSGDCAFLADDKVRPWWQSDDFAEQWISGSVRTIHASLSAWLGYRTVEPAWTCPRCGATMHRDRYLDDGGMQLGCGKCGLILDHGDVATHATMRTPMPLPDVARIIGVEVRTAQRWAAIVEPASTHQPAPRRPALYLAEDFARLATVIRHDERKVC